jgi:hypothetical protein
LFPKATLAWRQFAFSSAAIGGNAGIVHMSNWKHKKAIWQRFASTLDGRS